MKEISAFGCFMIVVVVLLVTIPVGLWGARVFFAEEIGKGNAEIQIQSAPSRITNYDYFFNQCASVQTLEEQIDAETNRLEQTEDNSTRNVILANLSGLQGQHSRAVNNYNARASADYTSGQFKASELPYQLVSPYVAGGIQTECGR
jgi:hypothetical protein